MKKSFLSDVPGCAPQLLAVVLGTLNAISDGMQFGWTSPMVPRFQTPDAPFQITETDVTWLEMTYMLSGIAGMPITIYLVDTIGRKKSVLLASASCLIGWVLIGVADKVWYLYAGRLINGLAADIAFICSPMYVAEIAHQKIRGFLSGLIYVMVFGGILLIYSIGPFAPVYVPAMVGSGVLLIQLCTFPFMPESPYYLLYKDRKEEAKKSLMQLRGLEGPQIEEELTDIAAAIARQKKETGRPLDLILVKSNRKAATIMTILNAAQHMAGVTVITMNVHLILTAAESIYLSPETSAILFGAVMLVATIICLLLIDMFGRKILLINSALLSGITLLTMAVFFHLKHNGVDVSAVSWIPIVCVMMFAAFFKSGLGIIPIVMTAELFPAKIKALGMGFADIVYILFSSVSIYVYRYLVESIGIFFPFYIFSACCFLTGLFTFCFIPETKGKTLEEIQMILKK
ncbi:facilitated trehalose transporter Tret1-like [Harmonia axyridis]|uniref:facilitated trehalose transporter Tret1-like n=1 Tax=Harmonia axyridis TaxID=115357 RepID=UPI001E2776B8|nr:facilitated trehalose transporter Tret1-like [Harmonia axyridis]